MLRSIREVDEVLRRLFRGVLQEHGARRPVLEGVDLRPHVGSHYCTITGSWTLDPPFEGAERDYLRRDASLSIGPGSALGRLEHGRHRYDVIRVWSEVYEDHYIQEMQRSADRAARDLAAVPELNVNSGLLDYLRRNAATISEHARQFHRDVTDAEGTYSIRVDPFEPVQLLGGDGEITHAYFTLRTVDVRPDEPVPEPLLAEMRQRVDEHMRQMFEDINAALATGTTTSTAPAAVASVQQTMQDAIEALGRRPARRARLEPASMLDLMAGPPPVWVDEPTDDMRALLARWMRLLTEQTPAEKRSMELLREHLTPEQRESYDARAWFEVIGGTTGRRYRIAHGRQMNIAILNDQGRVVRGLCFVPEGALPAGDCMLAQKLALELDEERALAVANEF